MIHMKCQDFFFENKNFGMSPATVVIGTKRVNIYYCIYP